MLCTAGQFWDLAMLHYEPKDWWSGNDILISAQPSWHTMPLAYGEAQCTVNYCYKIASISDFGRKDKASSARSISSFEFQATRNQDPIFASKTIGSPGLFNGSMVFPMSEACAGMWQGGLNLQEQLLRLVQPATVDHSFDRSASWCRILPSSKPRPWQRLKPKPSTSTKPRH